MEQRKVTWFIVMSIFLCGNTGIVNRGCEAIIRSSVKLLEKRGKSIYLASDKFDADRDLTKELGINYIPYDNAGTIQRATAKVIRLLNRNSLNIHKVLQAHLLNDIKAGDYCLNIGGDTYCYARPERAIALNKYASKKGAKTILWCCSIEKEAITHEIQEDLNRYDYIFVRESLSEHNLIDSGINQEKIVRVCDPAFFLDTKETELPVVFDKHGVVGINVSELVIRDGNETVYNSVIGLIKYILDNTEYGVCLIPHVYDIKRNICDWPKLSRIKSEINNDRVALVDRELGCEELKYIISKCRFMFTARTHASIAAYSSLVPTIVFGYSVKSKGIAQDLFGNHSHFVIPYDEITDESCLIEAFNMLESNEDSIKDRLREVLPNYKNLLIEAVDQIFINERKLSHEVCDKNLCTGCLACKQVCPSNAIVAEKDEYGFWYPRIVTDICNNCDKCRVTCPAQRKVKDDLTRPICYGAYINDDVVRSRSSSGGIFSLLARAILARDGIVFGAAFDGDMGVHHIGITDFDELDKLRRSKYVQSNLGNTFEEAKVALDKGRVVLYTGTPCQIEGLKAYLKKDYWNLYTQDIICHGVPAPKAWNDYLDSIRAKFSEAVTEVTFRDKSCGWKKESLKVTLETHSEENYLSEDPYYKGFIEHYYLRHSCFECSFRKYHRVSDITLGDFWGIDKIDADMFDDKGTSLIMIHSQKGRELLEAVKNEIMIKEYEFTDAIKHNPSYLESASPSPFEKDFRHKWKNIGFVGALDYFNRLSGCRLKYLFKRIDNWSWKD